MTPLREAFLLPGLFLTVTLLGGVRIADTVRLVPPPLTGLVLAVVLIGALVRSGVIVPFALLAPGRRPLENLSGAVVLLTLLAASAQAVHVVVPERGLLHFAFAVFLFVQLLSLSAAGIDRHGMLRSLFVLFGASFILRFIVLEALYDSDGGMLKRVLTAMLAGVSLGAIEYQPHAVATGYVAFATLALYLTGLVLMPTRPVIHTSAMTPTVRGDVLVPLFILIGAPLVTGCSASRESPVSQEALDGRRAMEQRNALFAAARVWMPPPVPPAAADFGVNPPGPGGFTEDGDVDCRLVVEPVNGLTPKFDCELADGTTVKVKYGNANAELYAEAAATRLLEALGFPADRMYVVRSVRCAGCPRFPFRALRCLGATGRKWPCFPFGVNADEARSFNPVVIERRRDGRKIEGFPDQGWAWYELDTIDASKGGSPRAEVDALRLLAVFLAHWDNKAENQRLICPSGEDRPDGGCARPLAMMQDLGATFGPSKLDLNNWRKTAVWADASACRVSMERLPFEGATFPEQQISEEGRQFLLQLIEQLSREQLETLFTSSRATTFESVSASSRDASAWAGVFLDKVRQIREAGPCAPQF